MKAIVYSVLLMMTIAVSSAIAKTVVTQDDLTYIGGFRIPTSITYPISLTHRYKDGNIVFYTNGYYSGARWQTVEFSPPASLSASRPFTAVSSALNYGNIFQDKIVDIPSNGTGSTPPVIGITNNITASISGTTLTVTASNSLNPILVGQEVTGVGVTENTRITAYITGNGGTGTYQIDTSQTVSSSAMTVEGASRPSLFWDKDSQRMYWTKVIGYENSLPSPNECLNDAGIGYSTLDDITHTGTGIASFRLDNKSGCGGFGGRYAFNMVRIPDDFSNNVLNGRKYAVGFGGGVSVVANGPPSVGPAVGILNHIPDVSTEDHLELLSEPPEVLVSHFYGDQRALLPSGTSQLNYRTGDTGYFGETEYFTLTDLTMFGAWVSGSTKAGLVLFGLTGGGNTLTTVSSVPVAKTQIVVADIGDIIVGDTIRVPTDQGGSYPWENKVVSNISGNTITLSTATTYNIVVGGDVVCGTWYTGGGGVVSRIWTSMAIYSEDDLEDVHLGTKSRVGLPPASFEKFQLPGETYPMAGGSFGASIDYPNAVRGVTFDGDTGKLYVMVHVTGGQADVFVYQLNDDISSHGFRFGRVRIGGSLSKLSAE